MELFEDNFSVFDVFEENVWNNKKRYKPKLNEQLLDPDEKYINKWFPICHYLVEYDKHKRVVNKYCITQFTKDKKMFQLHQKGKNFKTINTWKDILCENTDNDLKYFVSLYGLPLKYKIENGEFKGERILWLFKYQSQWFDTDNVDFEVWVIQRQFLNFVYGSSVLSNKSGFKRLFDEVCGANIFTNYMCCCAGKIKNVFQKRNKDDELYKKLPKEEWLNLQRFDRGSFPRQTQTSRFALIKTKVLDEFITKYNCPMDLKCSPKQIEALIIPCVPVLQSIINALIIVKCNEYQDACKRKIQLQNVLTKIKNTQNDLNNENCISNDVGYYSESSDEECDSIEIAVTRYLYYDKYDIHDDDFDIDGFVFQRNINQKRNYGLPIHKLNTSLKLLLETSFMDFRTDVYCHSRRKLVKKVTKGTAKSDIFNLLKYLGWLNNQENIEINVDTIETDKDLANLFTLQNLDFINKYCYWCTGMKKNENDEIKDPPNKHCTIANIMNSLFAIVIWLVSRGILDKENIDNVKALRDQAYDAAKANRSSNDEIPHKCRWHSHVQEAWKRSFDLAMSFDTTINLRNCLLIGFYSLYPPDRVSVIRNITFGKTLIRQSKWTLYKQLPKIYTNEDVFGIQKLNTSQWMDCVLTIQTTEYIEIQVFQNGNMMENKNTINKNKKCIVYIVNINVKIKIFEGINIQDYFQDYYWIVDTRKNISESRHKNTKRHGFTCWYPCNIFHGKIIESYYNKIDLAKVNNVVFYSNHDYKIYNSSNWGKYFKSVYQQYLPDDIPCPNPKDFRKVYITYLRSEHRSKEVLEGSAFIQKHSTLTSEMVYDQERKEKNMRSALLFTYNTSYNTLKKASTPNSENSQNTKTINKRKRIVTNDVYEVEELQGKRNYKKKIQYLVKWKGYPKSQNTWEFEENIFDDDLIKEYQNK